MSESNNMRYVTHGRLSGPVFWNHDWEICCKQTVNIIDLGSGDCRFVEQLPPRLPQDSTITCCDINFTNHDLSTTTLNGITKVRDLPCGTFDIVVLLDVIEHVADDKGFIQTNVLPKLTAGGMVLISAPAHPSLFSKHDEFLGHYRRYTRRQLFNVSEEFFISRKNGYQFSSLALIRFLQRLSPKKALKGQQGIGSWNFGKLLTYVVSILLSVDTVVSSLLQHLGLRLLRLTVWVSGSGKILKDS